jgi:hypothetical protein
MLLELLQFNSSHVQFIPYAGALFLGMLKIVKGAETTLPTVLHNALIHA